MRGDFCEPRSIRYRTFADVTVGPEELDEGIYRVVLRGANDGFFLDKHPFLYKRLESVAAKTRGLLQALCDRRHSAFHQPCIAQGRGFLAWRTRRTVVDKWRSTARRDR
jgi:hypothetical protein